MRVNPHASLQELAPTICSKCEFDPLHTLLLKDYQSQEPLDLTKSLNELGLRELYAMDVSRGKISFLFYKEEGCSSMYLCIYCVYKASEIHNYKLIDFINERQHMSLGGEFILFWY